MLEIEIDRIVEFYSSANVATKQWSPQLQLCLSGTAETALAYSCLFVPDTREVNGIIFLKYWTHEPESEFLATRVAALSEVNQELRAAKIDSFNWLDLRGSLQLGYPVSTATEEILERCCKLLGDKIAESWMGILHQRYPKREFIIEFINEFNSNGTYGILFKDKTKNLKPPL
jgi:hypothetical protein